MTAPTAAAAPDRRAIAAGRGTAIGIITAAGLFAAARCWRLTASCLWFDEIFSVHAAARHSWDGLLLFISEDIIHPPLFYLLLKIWIGVGGESLLWLRLFPALTSVAAIAPFLLLSRALKLTGVETAVALGLMAVSGYLIKYAQEVRMYSLLFFFTLCSLWLFVEFCRRAAAARKYLPALFAVNLLLVYTHYYGWLVVAAEAVFLLLLGARRKLLSFSVITLLLILCFAPWVYLIARAAAAAEGGGGIAQNIGWVSRPGWESLVQFYGVLGEVLYYRQSSREPSFRRTVWPALFLFACPVAVLGWQTLRGHYPPETAASSTSSFFGRGGGAFWWLLHFALFPVAAAFILSWLLPHSVWGTRHLIIVAAPCFMLVAIALCRLRPFWVRTTIAILIGCWIFLAGAVLLLLGREATYGWCAWSTLTREVVRSVSAQPPLTRNRPVRIFAFEDLVAYHLWFALSPAEKQMVRIEVIKGIPGLAEDAAYFLPRGFDEVGNRDAATLREEYFWIIFRGAAWDRQRPPLSVLIEKGYEVEKISEKGGVGERAFLAAARRPSQQKALSDE